MRNKSKPRKVSTKGQALVPPHREMLKISNVLVNNLVEIDSSVLLLPLHFWKVFNLKISLKCVSPMSEEHAGTESVYENTHEPNRALT